LRAGVTDLAEDQGTSQRPEPGKLVIGSASGCWQGDFSDEFLS
jgi:hypothetical protein